MMRKRRASTTCIAVSKEKAKKAHKTGDGSQRANEKKQGRHKQQKRKDHEIEDKGALSPQSTCKAYAKSNTRQQANIRKVPA